MEIIPGQGNQVIQIETSHDSCPIRFEQPTKFPGPSGCASCIRFGSLIVQSSQTVNRLIIEQLFHLNLGRTQDGMLKVCAVVMYRLFKLVLRFSASDQVSPLNT